MDCSQKKLKKVWLTCGIPASGKSTWIQKTIDEIGGVWCSRDKVRFSLVKEDEDYFAHEKQVFNTWVKEIRNALNNPEAENVFVDATHINSPSRNKILRRITDLPFDLTFVVFETPLKVCLERNRKREGRARVPDEVIEKMYNDFIVPSGDNVIIIRGDKNG